MQLLLDFANVTQHEARRQWLSKFCGFDCNCEDCTGKRASKSQEDCNRMEELRKAFAPMFKDISPLNYEEFSKPSVEAMIEFMRLERKRVCRSAELATL